METLILELAKYGPTTLLLALVIFLLRKEIAKMFQGGNGTADLVEALDRHNKAFEEFAAGMDSLSHQFEANNALFMQTLRTADNILTVINEARIDIARGGK